MLSHVFIACFMVLAAFIGVLLWFFLGKKAPAPTPAPAVENKDTQKHLEDLRSEDDELVAAKFRAMIHKPSLHPMQEPLRKAITLLAREWGLSVKVDHNVYDFTSHDKHIVHVTFECETRKVQK